MKKLVPVISCEHAGNQVPKAYAYLFSKAKEDLYSHRGWDPGAMQWAESLAKCLDVPLFSYPWTRLLVEINRSEDNPDLFSKYSTGLSKSVKNYLLDQYYRPHRHKVKAHIKALIADGSTVVHLGIHSFTPIWNGEERQVDMGLLFDEDRALEIELCSKLKKELDILAPENKIRFNEPYLGKDDGFTTYLRQQFSAKKYLGVEIEINQKFVLSDLGNVSKLLCEGVRRVLEDY